MPAGGSVVTVNRAIKRFPFPYSLPATSLTRAFFKAMTGPHQEEEKGLLPPMTRAEDSMHRRTQEVMAECITIFLSYLTKVEIYSGLTSALPLEYEKRP